MAAARTDILLTINSNLEGIRKAQEAFLTFKRQTEEAKKSVAELGSSLNSITKGLAIGAGALVGFTSVQSVLASVTTLFKSTITEGVKFNAVLEQSSFSIASVLKQFNPDKYKTFSEAIAESTGLIDQLRKKALETPATFEELLTGFQGSAGAMAAANIPLKKQIDLIVNMSQAMSALGIQTAELRQETTALLTGNIDRNARAAKTLGITAEDISGAKERGQLYEFLSEKLASFAEAGRLAQNSITTLQSNLKDATTQSAAESTKELTEAYRGLLISVTDLVKSDSFAQLASMTAGIAKQFVDVAAGMTQLFSNPAMKGSVQRAKQTSSEFDEARTQKDQDLAVNRAKSQLREVYNLETELNAKLAGNQKATADLKKAGAFLVGGPAGYAVAKAALDAEARGNQEQLQGLAQQREILQGILDRRKANGAEILQQNASLDETAAKEARVKLTEQKATQELAKLREDLAKDSAKNHEAEQKAALKNMTNLQKLEELKRKVSANEDALKVSPTAKSLSGNGPVTAEAEVAAESARAAASAKLLSSRRDLADLEKTISSEKKRQADDEVRAAEKALETQKQIAALEDRRRAQKLSDDANERERVQKARIQEIEANQLLTERQRRWLLYLSYQKEAAQLPGQISAAQTGFDTSKPDSAMQTYYRGELDRLKDRQAVGNPADVAENKPLTMIEESKQGLAQLADSFATIGQTISSTLGSALSSVSENLTGLIMQTKTWSDALRNVANTILTSVVGAIIQASVQWIARKVIEMTLGATLQKAALAASIPVAAGFAALWSGPATLATIASFGGAALAAPASIAGATAITKGMALTGFAKGGYTGPGGVNEIAGPAHKGEVIFSQRDVARACGVAAVENLRISGGQRDSGSVFDAGARVSRGSIAVGPERDTPINYAFFNTREDASVWLASQNGRREMMDFLKRESYAM